MNFFPDTFLYLFASTQKKSLQTATGCRPLEYVFLHQQAELGNVSALFVQQMSVRIYIALKEEHQHAQ